MADIFFPSCKAKAAFPGESGRLARYISDRFGIDPIGCCKVNYGKLTKNDRAIILCLNCARVIEANADYGRMDSLWELLDQDKTFSFPDYHGEPMTLQDCHLVKGRKQVQDAVRSLMRKMNIEIVERERNREEAEHCASHEIMGYHRETPMTKEEQREYFHKKYDNVETNCIVTYCKYCSDGVKLSGRQGRHMLELLFPERNV